MQTVQASRFGGLNILRQKHYTTRHDCYHSPPERYGFYAFAWPHVEMFLAYSTRKKEIENHEYKKFRIGGQFWTHQNVPPEHVIETRGSWYKVDVSCYRKVMSKSYANRMKEMRQRRQRPDWGYIRNAEGVDETLVGTPNNFFSKDDYEIFICRDTKILR